MLLVEYAERFGSELNSVARMLYGLPVELVSPKNNPILTKKSQNVYGENIRIAIGLLCFVIFSSFVPLF